MNPTNNNDQRASQPLSQPLLDVFGLLDLVLPDECVAGVQANLELMKVHARIVEAFGLPESTSKAVDA